ncbi:MAG: hypothetical protein WKF87_06250 [Chryseolinea sp.]
MKNLIQLFGLLTVAFLMTSCEMIGDIFGAGVYAGVFLVVLVVVIIFFIIRKLGRRE